MLEIKYFRTVCGGEHNLTEGRLTKMIYVSEMDGKKSETKETKGCGCGFGVTMPELSGGRGVHGKE